MPTPEDNILLRYYERMAQDTEDLAREFMILYFLALVLGFGAGIAIVIWRAFC